ncbi:MAG: hypothetical protein LBS25_03680 [Candidatus Symbiothrix sp.]|jgi:hypothetical protein|nr:hypothetical protein [Candidatus Symbiothrix sp.]
MKRHYKSRLWKMSMAAVFVCSVFFACNEDPIVKLAPFDSSQPTTIAELSDSGRVASMLLIYGKNFGDNKDEISVFVDGKKAAVIGMNPITDKGAEITTGIYAIIPSLKKPGEYREEGEIINAEVKLIVKGNEIVSDQSLAYKFSMNVSTFLGFTNQDGQSAIVDGKFEDVQFQTPTWLTFDKQTQQGTSRNFFVIEESTEPNWNNGSIRFVDMEREQVSMVFKAGNNLNRPRTIAFTLDYDTMIIANDAGNWSDIGTVIIPRDTITGRFDRPGVTYPWTIAMRHKQCNGGAIHPATGDYWFNSYEKGQVYKVYNRNSIPWRYGGKSATQLNDDGKEGTHAVIDKVQDTGWEFSIQIAPSGNFAYYVVRNQHYIGKLLYDWEKQIFENMGAFVGDKQRAGYKNGMNTEAMFNNPQQGAFDKDDNFYVCDGNNNCIRMVTPMGQVSVFAGRPESTAGYSDGALRDAQFAMPLGIIYDEVNQCFYVGDRDNHRVRAIRIE